LDLTKSSEPIHEHGCGESGGDTGHAPEPEVIFFHEVFEVHAVKGSDEGAGTETEGKD
jgi:hypothetical protein